MDLDLDFKTPDSSVSPGLSRCKPHSASKSIKCLLLFSKTSLCVPSLLTPSGFSKWHFLWPFHFPWTHFLVPRAAPVSYESCPSQPSGDPGEEPSTSAASTARPPPAFLPCLPSPPPQKPLSQRSPVTAHQQVQWPFLSLRPECLTLWAISSSPLWKIHFCFYYSVVFYLFPPSGWDFCSLSASLSFLYSIRYKHCFSNFLSFRDWGKCLLLSQDLKWGFVGDFEI